MKIDKKRQKIACIGMWLRIHFLDLQQLDCWLNFCIVARVVKYLAWQGLPFHENNEDAGSFEGSLYQFLLLEVRDITDMGAWLR